MLAAHPTSYLGLSSSALWAPGTFQVALVIKNPPANAGDPGDEVPSVVCEDPLEEGTATYSSILAEKIS